MNQRYFSAISTQVESMPALPATVSRVMAVTGNPDSEASHLIEAILPDQSMCTAILKVANSAFFGIPRTVSTIERAVVVLGFEEIKNIVIGKAIFAAFPKLPPDIKPKVGLFWEHAFTCGLAAKIIAEDLHLSPSEYFIAGLIHDIGKLAMLLTFPAEYPLLREITEPGHISCEDEETAIYSTSHDKVGRQIAERWLLPPQLIAAIANHHSPQHAAEHHAYPLVVQVADILSLLYCCSDVQAGADINQIFEDFLPETISLWQTHKLAWPDGRLGHWFETLQERRESDQGILNILQAP